MDEIKNKFIKNFSTYFIVDAVNKALPFLILPVIAAYLTPAEYGIISNFSALVQIFTAFIALNSFTKLTTDYFKERNSLPKLYSNLSNLIFILAVVIIILVIFFNKFILRLFHIQIYWQIAAVITATEMAFINLYTSFLRMRGEAIKYGSIQLLQSTSFFGLSILFVVVFLWSWKGSVLSTLTSYTTIGLIVFLIVFKQKYYQASNFNKTRIWNYFLWGIPLLPHALSYWLKFGADKIMISNYLSLADNGIYSLALTIGGSLSLVNTSFFNTYSPYIYRKLYEYDNVGNSEKKCIIKRLMKNSYLYLTGIAIISIVAYFALAFIINMFFKGDYLKAIQMLPYTILINFITSIYTIYSGFLFYRNKTKVIGSITFSSALIQIALNFTLLPKIGVYGALYSGIISAALMSTIITFISLREYKII